MDKIAYIYSTLTISKELKYILLFSPYSTMDKIAYIYSTLTISKELKYILLYFPNPRYCLNIDNTQNIFLVV